MYGKACHLLIKLMHKAYRTIKFISFNYDLVGEKRKLQINILKT